MILYYACQRRHTGDLYGLRRFPWQLTFSQSVEEILQPLKVMRISSDDGGILDRGRQIVGSNSLNFLSFSSAKLPFTTAIGATSC